LIVDLLPAFDADELLYIFDEMKASCAAALARNKIMKILQAGATRRMSRMSRAQAIGAVSLGALAMGAFAIGALALGALAIGRLAVGRARIGRLEIDELIIRQRDES
jgi:hypothetical protein